MKRTLLLVMLAIGLLQGCSYTPTVYNAASYLADTGFATPEEWYRGFITRSTSYEHHDQLDPNHTRMADSPAPSDFKFKGPVAVLFRNSGEYSFIELPGFQTAGSITEAKTLMVITYSPRGKHSYGYTVDFYDMATRLKTGEYGDSFYEGFKAPGMKYIITKSADYVRQVQLVDEGEDNIAVYDYYFDRIDSLLQDRNSDLFSTISSFEPTGRTEPDTLKLAGYGKKDLKAFIDLNNERAPFVRLDHKARSMPEDEDWIIIATAIYDHEYLGRWYEVWVSSGFPTGRSGDNIRQYYNVYFINGKDGEVITEYSFTTSSGFQDGARYLK
jgi:hypothetical protein